MTSIVESMAEVSRLRNQGLSIKENCIHILFGDTFRQDIVFHSRPAMVEVGMLDFDQVVALGLTPENIAGYKHSVGLLIDDEKNILYATDITTEISERMSQMHEKYPDTPWSQVKRLVFVRQLMEQDQDISLVTPVAAVQHMMSPVSV